MKIGVRHLLLIGFLCTTFAACAPKKVLSVQDYSATFICDGNRPVRMRFAPFKAELEFQGVSVFLVQQPDAGGFRYIGGGQSLRQRGHEAIWIDDKNTVRHCRDDARGDANPINAPHTE